MHLSPPLRSENGADPKKSTHRSNGHAVTDEFDSDSVIVKQRRPYTALVGILGIAIGLVGGWWIATRQFREQSKIALDHDTTYSSHDAIPITVGQVVHRTIRRQIDAIGSVHAFEDLVISAKTTGRVVKLRCDLADRVVPGALLLEIDPTDFQLAVALSERSLEAERVRWGINAIPSKDVDVATLPPVLSARLRLDLTKTKLARFESLLKSNSISRDDFDQSQSDAAIAESEWQNQILLARSSIATIVLREAELDVNRQKLKDTQVFSPMPTVELSEEDRFYSIAQRMVSEGTMVRPGDPLFRLILGRSVKVSLRLQERHNESIVQGQQVEIEISSLGDVVRGSITRISPVVDPMTRTFIVEIEVPNEESKLKPGGFVKAKIFTGREERVPTIPIVALDTFAGLNKVFIVEQEKATEHLVRLGFQNDDWIEIVEPAFSEGAFVATSAQRMLSNGISITVKNLPPSEADRSIESASSGPSASDVTR